MKRLFTVILALCLLTLTACAKPETGGPSATADKTADATARNIASAAAPPTAAPPDETQSAQTGPGATQAPVRLETEPVKEANATVSVSCAALLGNLDKLSADKRDLVPADGLIVPPVAVSTSEGLTAFSALQMITILTDPPTQLDKTEEAGFVYIKSIGNLYERDAGPQSGWQYTVNGESPNVAASEYVLKDGDNVEFVYLLEWTF